MSSPGADRTPRGGSGRSVPPAGLPAPSSTNPHIAAARRALQGEAEVVAATELTLWDETSSGGDRLALVPDHVPYQSHSATSREAADAIRPTRTENHKRILAFLREAGAATDEKIATELGLNPSSARPRRIELYRAGLVVEAGVGTTRSGRSAQMWSVA